MNNLNNSGQSCFECNPSETASTLLRNGSHMDYSVSANYLKESSKEHKGETRPRQQTKIKCSRCRCWKNEKEFINQGDSTRLMRTCNSCRKRNKSTVTHEVKPVVKRVLDHSEDAATIQMQKPSSEPVLSKVVGEPDGTTHFSSFTSDMNVNSSSFSPEAKPVPTYPMYPQPYPFGYAPYYPQPAVYYGVNACGAFSFPYPAGVNRSYSDFSKPVFPEIPYSYLPYSGSGDSSCLFESKRAHSNVASNSIQFGPLSSLEILAALSRKELCSLEHKHEKLSFMPEKEQ